MKSIDLVLVCVDDYHLDYARKLITRLQDVSDFKINPYCIVDHRVEPANKFSTAIWQSLLVPGWWNKMQVYNIDKPENWTLYMDLDIVIQQNFDEVIQHVIDADNKDSITCVSDALGWMGNKFSSSWMMFYGKRQSYIYRQFAEEFTRNPDVTEFKGGDQVWIGENINPKVHYIDEQFPNLKKNLKFDLSTKHDSIPTAAATWGGDHVVYGKWKIPLHVSDDIKLVDCGGRPKPHELQMVPYINRNWFQI